MWNCGKCDAAVTESFDACWKCGADREGNLDPDFEQVPDDPSVPDPGYEDESLSNPYQAPALLQQYTVDPRLAHNRLNAIRRSVLLIGLVCVCAGILFVIQFGARRWYLAKHFPEHITRFWGHFGFVLYWRLPLSGICFMNAYFLWRYARRVRRVTTGQSDSFDAMFASQRAVWMVMAISIGCQLLKELLLILRLASII